MVPDSSALNALSLTVLNTAQPDADEYLDPD